MKVSMILTIVVICICCLTDVNAQNQINQTIDCVRSYIDTFQSKMRPELFRVFKKAFPNTLETTVQHYNITNGSQFTYIITGDIEAMWLRDSTNQWLPYLTLERQCPHIKELTKGLLNAQAQFIMTDPYTNAFKKFEKDPNARPFYLNDTTHKLIMGIPVDLTRHRQYATKPIWERKWEIDSLASFLRLTYEFYNKYHDLSIINMNFIQALKRVMTTLNEQIQDQSQEKKLGINYYTFFRDARQLPNGLIKSSSRTGMIKTGFRPSDDPNQLPYNVPGNAMMASFLKLVSNEVLDNVPSNSIFYSTVLKIQKEMLFFVQSITEGISNYAIVERPQSQGGNVYAYQVDGFGKFRLYDDANLPSLLSFPYLGFVNKYEPMYKNTRALVLSKKNVFYYEAGLFKGQGSSHTQRGYIWPLALIVQALTTDDDAEITNCLYNLQKSAKDDLIHESFNVDNPSSISREWFAWANSFFGEMIVTLSKTKPDLLK